MSKCGLIPGVLERTCLKSIYIGLLLLFKAASKKMRRRGLRLLTQQGQFGGSLAVLGFELASFQSLGH